MPGAGRNPWPACRKKRRRQSPQVQPKQPAFPARWFERLYVISPGTGLIAPVVRMLVAPRTWPQHREARTTRFHVRISRARLAPPTTATAPRPYVS